MLRCYGTPALSVHVSASQSVSQSERTAPRLVSAGEFLQLIDLAAVRLKLSP
jgi:hypothetical protein